MSTLNTNRIEFEEALAALLAAYGTGAGSASGYGTVAPRLSLINYAKVKLDEIIPEGEGVQFSVEDDINISDPLNILIDAILNEAAKRTLMNAPIQVLYPVISDAYATPNANDNKTGKIVLPDNFLRFVSLKMADWERPVTEVISIQDVKYKAQSNVYTRGGVAKPVAALTTAPLGYGTAVTQVDKLTLSGEDTANIGVIKCAELEHMIVCDTDLTTVAAIFVSDNAADYLNVGVILTSLSETLIFTAVVAGTAFTHPIAYRYQGDDFVGTVEYTTPNINPNVYYRVLEYYSVKTSHTVDYLYYIKETVAEEVQSNLHDALTWIAAGMVLNITERVDLAKVAFEQEQLCYLKL